MGCFDGAYFQGAANAANEMFNLSLQSSDFRSCDANLVAQLNQLERHLPAHFRLQQRILADSSAQLLEDKLLGGLLLIIFDSREGFFHRLPQQNLIHTLSPSRRCRCCSDCTKYRKAPPHSRNTTSQS